MGGECDHQLRSLTRGLPITGFESSVCCVSYCYPTSYRGRSTLGTHSFPKGQGTLFTGIYIYIYIYQSWYIATYKDRKNIFKMNKEVRMLLPKKRPNTSRVGKINNYYEDIYIPPYINTD